jgi:PAS domain S-box-containing protein
MDGEPAGPRLGQRRYEMEAPSEHSSGEIKDLQRCISDLVSVLTLPAIWTGSDPSQILSTLLDALLSMQRLDFVYARLNDPSGESPIEMLRASHSRKGTASSQEIGNLLADWFGNEPQKWPVAERTIFGESEISIVPLRLGLQGEAGVIVAGSERAEFPRQTERLLLTVAANQAAIGLHEARLRSQQKLVAAELDQRVAQRTMELAAANDVLKMEVAERRRAEEALQRSEAFLAEGQHLSRTGSFSWRVATNEITWSEQMYRIFEFDQDAPVTLARISARVHPEDIASLNALIERVRVEGSDFEFEHRLQMPDGSVKYLHMVAHANQDREGRPEYIGAVQDVTQRRTSEAELSKVHSELTRVTRATTLGTMTASIAHEVNQPLSGIVTNAGTCLRMLSADPPNVDGARETARRTIRDGNRASEVINRLRALFSNKDTAADSVDLNEAIREVIALSVTELQRNKVILHLELAEDLPLVTGDRIQLQQVIMNLLRNASDAMIAVEDRPRRLVIRTEQEEGDRVRLIVQDEGVGLDPQAMDKLFETFYTTKNDGMGIGLSVSRSIIERHHGRLWATSNDGPGASFLFSIPRRSEGSTGADGNSGLRTRAATDSA